VERSARNVERIPGIANRIADDPGSFRVRDLTGSLELLRALSMEVALPEELGR
jgi:hypothetical protein